MCAHQHLWGPQIWQHCIISHLKYLITHSKNAQKIQNVRSSSSNRSNMHLCRNRIFPTTISLTKKVSIHRINTRKNSRKTPSPLIPETSGSCKTKRAPIQCAQMGSLLHDFVSSQFSWVPLNQINSTQNPKNIIGFSKPQKGELQRRIALSMFPEGSAPNSLTTHIIHREKAFPHCLFATWATKTPHNHMCNPKTRRTPLQYAQKFRDYPLN